MQMRWASAAGRALAGDQGCPRASRTCDMLLRRPASAWRALQGFAARPCCLGLRASYSAAPGAADQQAGGNAEGHALLAYWRGLLDDRQRPRGSAGVPHPLPGILKLVGAMSSMHSAHSLQAAACPPLAAYLLHGLQRPTSKGRPLASRSICPAHSHLLGCCTLALILHAPLCPACSCAAGRGCAPAAVNRAAPAPRQGAVEPAGAADGGVHPGGREGQDGGLVPGLTERGCLEARNTCPIGMARKLPSWPPLN